MAWLVMMAHEISFGWSWGTVNVSRPAARHAVCLDFSAVRPEGSLVAYRWAGEDAPTADRFVAYPALRVEEPSGPS